MLAGNDDPNLPLVTCSTDGKQVYLLDKSIISGEQIENATSGLDQQRGEYVVDLQFKGDAADVWADFTAANVGTQTAFTLDSKVVSAPADSGSHPRRPHPDHRPVHRRLRARTGQRAEVRLAAAVVRVLGGGDRFGDTGFDVAAGGPDRRRDRTGAGADLLPAVLPGARPAGRFLADRFGRMVYAILVLLGRYIGYTLDLAGIAGLIIGIGMTADSFVVFFERIKDEMREGRSFRSAVPRGWARARATILSGNAVSFTRRGGALRPRGRSGEGLRVHPGSHHDPRRGGGVPGHRAAGVPRLEVAVLAKPSVNGLGAVQQIARERRAAAQATGRG